MLGDVQQDALLESEFEDEYQDWIHGRPSASRAAWFDYPARKLARRELLSVSRELSVHEVAGSMAAVGAGSALVMEAGRLLGIFTERDLVMRVVAAGLDPRTTPVERVMSDSPEVLPESATIAQALRFLAQGHYRHAPLVDDAGRPVGMLSTGMVIAFVSDTFPKEILNAPPETAEPILEEEGP
jgi:CBS domain-containing protein